MLDSHTVRKPIPYYGSYAGFYRAMWALKSHGVPRLIETRVFSEKNLEAEASRIVAGFGALGWTDEAGRPNDSLKKLVDAFGTAHWGAAVAEVLPQSYPFLQEMDLESATNDQISEAFVTYLGRSAATLRNAETFFLCLAMEAGLPMSERLSRRADRGVGDARKWLKQAQAGAFEDDETTSSSDDEPSKADTDRSNYTGSLTDKIVDLTALLSEGDMTTEEKAAVVTLLAYLARRLKRGGK